MLELKTKYDALIESKTIVKQSWGKSSTEIDHSSLSSEVVNLILMEAIESRGSDIHLEPVSDGLRVRFRIDGRLMDALFIPDDHNLSVIPRIKVMCNLNVDAASSRGAQDGRFETTLNDQHADFRVSTFPTIDGEKVVLRVMGDSVGIKRVEEIVTDKNMQKRLLKLLMYQQGLIIVSGPTGSGKTTTLYALLNQINSPEKNIVTLEDPVEYNIPGINQCSIDVKKNFNFADGLRAVLRQDPDAIFVGEMRDSETAEIALRASITGHLVLSTVHANSAVETVMRLVNMGLSSYMVTHAVIGTVAQRLVRKVCTQCKQPKTIKKSVLERYGYRGDHASSLSNVAGASSISYAGAEEDTETCVVYEGSGCPYCHDTGFRGRVGVYEVIVFDDPFRDLIIRGAGIQQLKNHLHQKGVKMLLDDAFDKVLAGETTIDEISHIIVGS